MTGPLLVFVLGMTVCSILMVLAMLPFSLELLSPSADMAQHRHRVRTLGAIGVFTEKLIPHFFDHVPPKRFWGAIYIVTWICILYFITFVVRFSEGGLSAQNLWVSALVVGGWFGIHGLIIWFGRAIERANRRTMEAAQAGRAAAGSAMANEGEDEASDESEPTEMAPGASTSAASDVETALKSDAAAKKPTVGQRIKDWLWMLTFVFVVIVVCAIAQEIPLLQRLDQFIAARHAALLGLAIALTAMGFVMFMGGLIHMMLVAGTPMSPAEVEALMARNMLSGRPGAWRAARYRFKGETVGREGGEEWSLLEMKEAWRIGLWWRDPVWRRRFIIVAGVFIMMTGGFGIVIVQGPPGIKLLAAGAVLYALVRTAWAFLRAQPDTPAGGPDRTF